MKNVENSQSRSAFFPQDKRGSVNRGNSKIQTRILEGNDPVRKKELDDLTKSDASVNINDATKDFAKIKKIVDATPPLDNNEKIAQLKDQIKNGTYKIDYDELASKILDSEY